MPFNPIGRFVETKAPREKLDNIGQSSPSLGLGTPNRLVLGAKRATC
jgi:hypothetical protein